MGRFPYRTDNDYLDLQKGHRDTGDAELAKEIRKARKALGMTQKSFGDFIGVRRSRLAQWETAKRAVPWAEIDNVRRHLPADVAERLEPRWSTHHQQVTGLRAATV